MIISFDQTTIKHSMYMQKVPFLCTERACVVLSGYGIRPGRKVTWSKVLQVLWTRGSNEKLLHTDEACVCHPVPSRNVADMCLHKLSQA